jgi:hypothetical protein
MAKTIRNFIKGRMNKESDERLIQDGEYIDALNIRIGSTELDEMGVVENAKGNTQITSLQYNGNALSGDAVCIGAFEDGSNETLYWFVHDPSFVSSPTGKIDLVVSYNTLSSLLTYHIISIDDGGGVNTTLNFDPQYLITGIDMVDDLLFFTDDYNQPRKINVKRSYGVPTLSGDGFTYDEILVIKRPPAESPSFVLSNTNQQQNFLEDRYICFAYRYRYDDDEYSATSQFTSPAFTPNSFLLSIDTYLNDGMSNAYNTANVTINTGSSLVKGIDILFKEADDSIIKVIEKLDKQELGLTDNASYTFTFTNSKIFTILPDYEILRLYDNVPRLAKAETIMGNRLVYGNYLEDYDLVDKYGNETILSYFTELITSDIGSFEVSETKSLGEYFVPTYRTVNNAVVTFNLSGFSLKTGSRITFNFQIEHDSFYVDPVGTATPGQTNQNVLVSFTYILPADFSSVFDLASSASFQDYLGTISNIQPAYPSPCDGTTFTDQFNCAVQSSLGIYSLYESGYTGVQEPIAIIYNVGSDEISFALPVLRYVDDLVSPTQNVYEYLYFSAASGIFEKSVNKESLHSNRGYEVGIVYMDEFNRSTTALVSPTNTVHIPCGNSYLQNKIRVTIPSTQVAPSWATRYKFVIKQDRDRYETVYSTFSVQDENDNSTYLLLQGQNSTKVEIGDRLIVKSDNAGYLNSCKYVTILDKETKEENFLGEDILSPKGAYVKIKSSELSLLAEGDSVVDYQLYTATTLEGRPIINQPMNYTAGSGTDFTIPTGSQIKIILSVFRPSGYLNSPTSENRPISYSFTKTFTSSANYSNLYEWWSASDIEVYLNDGIESNNGNPPTITFNPTLGTSFFNFGSASNDEILMRFTRIGEGDGKLYLRMQGLLSANSWGINVPLSSISCKITVFRANNTLIFETEPSDTAPDIFYEADESFSINSDGEHSGNVQDQDIALNQSAIIDTSFYNCYAFGNGAESYKIRDSIKGKQFNLGNRVTSTQAKDYEESRRFADLTYSGVYNDETNVNRLNEFNLGLANFKPLERSFGSIQKLFTMETDILVLQEDKISYVLAEKNLLSDATGQSSITSVPEVLGKQIARIEKFGISENPESFVSWGYDKFFTDAKRNAVIQLSGSGQGDSLAVVSDMGMRSWFRDLFTSSFNTQKLGGYDPYSHEYVLSSNEKELPSAIDSYGCGSTYSFFVEQGDPFSYELELGYIIGVVNINYNFIEGGELTVTWNGTPYTTGAVTGSGTLSFYKDSPTPTTADVVIDATVTGSFEVTALCPVGSLLNVVEVCVSSLDDAEKYIHNEFRFTQGGYNSPIQSTQVQLSSEVINPIVSQYQITTGNMGTGVIPSYGSTVRVFSNKFGNDNYDWEADDNLMWLYTDTQYQNNSTDISALLAAATDITPVVQSGNTYYGDFTMPLTSAQYLYIIYDYRNKVAKTDLCYDASSSKTACCGCL